MVSRAGRHPQNFRPSGRNRGCGGGVPGDENLASAVSQTSHFFLRALRAQFGTRFLYIYSNLWALGRCERHSEVVFGGTSISVYIVCCGRSMRVMHMRYRVHTSPTARTPTRARTRARTHARTHARIGRVADALRWPRVNQVRPARADMSAVVETGWLRKVRDMKRIARGGVCVIGCN